ncbi:MAG: TerB family tellurite resistance protein [Bacteroidaceae bacterium]|nr:TerB family tellurite resistance protein [Bacteroidaceae bacterium]
MKTLEELKKELLADGIIDAAEVKELEDVLFADGLIDKDEADFLFELNNAVSGKANAPEWKAFFVKAITSFVLDDDQSKGEIDDDEAKYLYEQINGDGKIDDLERALLENIRAKSMNFPALLAELL